MSAVKSYASGFVPLNDGFVLRLWGGLPNLRAWMKPGLLLDKLFMKYYIWLVTVVNTIPCRSSLNLYMHLRTS